MQIIFLQFFVARKKFIYNFIKRFKTYFVKNPQHGQDADQI